MTECYTPKVVSSEVISNTRTPGARPSIRLALLLPALAAVGLAMGCASPAYYWQAASGHLALMKARQDVDEAIERGEADEATLAKLRLSREIRGFAVQELGVPGGGSYETFVRTGRDAVAWNVVAAPEFSLQAKEWCFPIAGCVPYRGYFDRAAAERFAEKLRRRGLDVAVSPAIAYSTLGWFDDPLLDTMWKHSDAQLAAYLFHELAHQKLYLKGDATFNESYATFVEGIGVTRWLGQRGEHEVLENWLALSGAQADFSALLAETRELLRGIYRSPAAIEAKRAAKRAAFERLQTRYREMRLGRWRGRDYFGGWFEQQPNNARFALIESYQGGRCAFEALYAEAGSDIRRFHELARAKSRLPSDERREWLQRPCADIAPTGEL